MKDFIKFFNNRFFWIILTMTSIAYSIVHLIIGLLVNFYLKEDFDREAFIIKVCVSFTFTIFLVILYSYINISKKHNTNGIKEDIDSLRKKILEDEEYENTEDLREKISNNINNEKDILELMLDNMGEIKKYYSISKDHVQFSFILAVATCTVGLLLMGCSIILAFVIKEFDSALIATISGAVTELFAGTALIVHRSSIKQLNHYYKALHENEQFLSTINLVSKISKEKQDDIYIEIIKNSLAKIELQTKNTNKEEPQN